jgi:CheY-like chemotaxis protein/HPt (histidine-containing phosphotransfer) domain-containing protein
MMSGAIGVESEEGVGSTFWFTVPLQEQEKANLFEDLPGDFFSGLRVLVVDDNASAREAMRNYLEHWGCLVDEAERGTESLAKMKQSVEEEQDPYALVLVDRRMPGIDGWQLASEVISDPLLAGMKLILLTPEGLGSGEAKMRLLRWFNGYLSKPVKRGALLAEVFKVLTLEYEPALAELEAAEEAELVEELEEIPEAGGEPVEQGKPPGVRILVVEDHRVNQQLFKTILEKLGHQVFLAGDGAQALEAVGRQQYELIFMDVQMPNMNGYDATRKLREMGIGIPIIAVTASAQKEVQEKAKAAGMNHCLTKPFKKRDLIPVLDQWLPAAAQEAEPGVQQPSSGSEVFDFRRVVEAFMGQEEVVRDVLSSFLMTVEDQIARLPAAIEGAELEGVRQEAHAMKGGAWNLSAAALGDAARTLEEAAKAGDSDACRTAFGQLQGEFERLKIATASERL